VERVGQARALRVMLVVGVDLFRIAAHLSDQFGDVAQQPAEVVDKLRGVNRFYRFVPAYPVLGEVARLVDETPAGAMFERVTFDPNVMGGRACIRGMRITVSLIVNLVANGMSADEIVREYPALEPEDVRQALAYASALANEEVHLFTSPAA